MFLRSAVGVLAATCPMTITSRWADLEQASTTLGCVIVRSAELALRTKRAPPRLRSSCRPGLGGTATKCNGIIERLSSMSRLTSNEQTSSRPDVRNELGDRPCLELHRHGVATADSIPLIDGERGARNLSKPAVVDAAQRDQCSVERSAPLGPRDEQWDQDQSDTEE